MARRLILGHRLSRFSPDEERDGLRKCLTSTFLPASHGVQKPYVASGYLSGDIRIYDTDAMARSATDGMSVIPVAAFPPESCSIIQLKTLTTEAETVLLALQQYGVVRGLSLKTVYDDTDSEEEMSRLLFQTGNSASAARAQCFAVDNANKRIFTGTSDGTWLSWDVSQSSFSEDLTPYQSYRAHQAPVLDGDYHHGLLASASEDGAVCVWDIRSKSCVCAFDPATAKHLPLSQTRRSGQCSQDAALCVRFDSSGRHVVASSRRKRITVWNIRSDSAQCAFHTEAVPYALDTAEDCIFFTSADERIWRYFMFNAEMECYPTSTHALSHVCIERETEKMMVVSGGADSVELLSVDGKSLGKVSARKDPNYYLESHPLLAAGYLWSPSILSSPGAGGTPVATPQYTPEIEDMCDSGSDMISEDEEEELLADDQGSSVFEYSQVQDDESPFASDDEAEEMQNVDVDGSLTAGEFMLYPPVTLEGQELQAPYFFTSDSDNSLRHEFGTPVVPDYSNCEFSSSQGDSGTSEEEDEDA